MVGVSLPPTQVVYFNFNKGVNMNINVEQVLFLETHQRYYREIIKLVEQNSYELSMYPYNLVHPLNSYLTILEKEKLKLQLQWVNENSEKKQHLFIAKNEKNHFLGFAICAPDLYKEHSANLVAIMVKPEFRKQGVFTELMKFIQKKYINKISLMCDVDLVQLYEKFGFHIFGVEQAYLGMHNNDDVNDKKYCFTCQVEEDSIMQLDVVEQEKRKLITKLGQEVFIREYNKLIYDINKKSEKAKQYLESKKS